MRHLPVQDANNLITVAIAGIDEVEVGIDHNKAEATEIEEETETVAWMETRNSETNPNGTHRVDLADLAASGEIIGAETIMEIKVCMKDCRDSRSFKGKY